MVERFELGKSDVLSEGNITDKPTVSWFSYSCKVIDAILRGGDIMLITIILLDTDIRTQYLVMPAIDYSLYSDWVHTMRIICKNVKLNMHTHNLREHNFLCTTL